MTPWTRDAELADTMPCPAMVDHDGAEAWVDQFLATARDQDTWLAILLAADFASEAAE